MLSVRRQIYFLLCDKGFLIFRSDGLVWSLSLCLRFKLVKDAFIDVPLSRVSSSQTERFLICHGCVSIKKMKSSSFFYFDLIS